MSDWVPFPHACDDYRYHGDSLKSNWLRLHEGDREPFPDAEWVEQMDAEYGVLEGRSPQDVAAALQDAWRAYHAGEFGEAVRLGEELGPIGNYVANKATGIYAVYLESDEDARLTLFQEIADACQTASEQMPGHANSWYFRAFALGRYSQGISIVKALKQGIAGDIKTCLDQAIELEPEHADAHTAIGLYHAEILDKVGGMLGSLTYGANAKEGKRHFETALKCAPNSAIAQIEYGNGLIMLDGDDAYDAASDLYVAASECEPADAMERMDVELALSELE